MSTPHPEKRSAPPEAAPGMGSRPWVEVGGLASPVLLVPLGSCEQHGPHLPLDTDTRIAVAVAGAVADRRHDAVVAPALAYGSSGEHQGFPGTLSIGTDALRTALIELGRSALADPGTAPFRGLVFVNGHGGNRDAVRGAVQVLAGEGRAVSSWSPSVPGGDAHAGRTETSLMLAIAPELVGPDRPAGATAPIADLLPALRSGGVAAVSPSGVLGDPAGASAEEGVALLADLAGDLDGHVGRS